MLLLFQTDVNLEDGGGGTCLVALHVEKVVIESSQDLYFNQLVVRCGPLRRSDVHDFILLSEVDRLFC